MQRLFSLGRDLGIVFLDLALLEQAIEHIISKISYSRCLPTNKIDLLLILIVKIISNNNNFKKGCKQV